VPEQADDLRRQLAGRLPPALRAFLAEAATRAAGQGTPLYLVGGAVRDLLLGQPSLDLDLVLASPAPALAAALAVDYHLEWTSYPAFGTATLRLSGALTPPPPASPYINLVTARREIYPAPAALPVVTPGTMADDLARRDFTINALALPLDPPGGPLIDPHGGQADLAAGRLRVLHDASFRDDPTRILRAARYEQRFGFALEPHTLALLHAAVQKGALARLSGERIRNELLRTLDEADPTPAMARMAGLGALAAIDPALDWDAAGAAEIRRVSMGWDQIAPGTTGQRRDALLAVWLSRLALLDLARVITRLRLDKPQGRLVSQLAQARAAVLPRLADPQLSPAALVQLLEGTDPLLMAILAILTDDPTVQQHIDAYTTRLRHIHPLLTGADLRALGIPPGPHYRAILAALREGRLAGRLVTRADEEAFVHELVAQNPP
jgi:tRNA nucleotidyltransferase (CCA-adding enzyme)